ncbi:MAG: glycerophosphodiester phosphodiesterase family protein [bacterium]
MRIVKWVALVSCLALAVVAGCGDDDGESCTCPADEVINCGHRGTGVSGVDNPYPENTIPSFQQAVTEGAQMIELDVMHSADGELVVIHDDTVNRTTDGAGCVGDLTVSELQGLDAALYTTLAGTGVTIPTLAEVLASVEVPVNIEIKVTEDASCPAADLELLAADVVDAIHNDTAAREIVVSSFEFEVLTHVQDLDPTIYTGYLTLLWSDAQDAADQGFSALNVFGIAYDADDIQNITDTGLEANVWTINDPGQMDVMLGAGVSMIITDDPDVLEATRDAWCADYCATVVD